MKNSINISKNNFENCLKCTVCTFYCPLLAVGKDFPGPKQAGADQERFRLKSGNYYDPRIKACLNCKRCEVVCPSGVRIADLIQSAKIAGEGRPMSPRDFLLSNTDLAGSIATKVAPLANRILAMPIAKQLMDSVASIDHRRTMPTYASKTFEQLMRKQADAQKQFDKKVAYFHGCYVNYNNPQSGLDMVKIYNALGYGVEMLSKEKCCGVALIANRLVSQARRQAEVNLKSIREAMKGGAEKVVSSSSTCVLTMRDDYPHILGLDNADVRGEMELATKHIYSLLEQPEYRNKLKFKESKKLRVAYHTACHMSRLGWRYYSVELLKMLPNVELTVLEQNCCGIAGTYGFKSENYETAQQVGQKLFDDIQDGDYDIIASDCETCRWQINMSTGKECLNPISIFANMII